jgi:hypothetical protein
MSNLTSGCMYAGSSKVILSSSYSHLAAQVSLFFFRNAQLETAAPLPSPTELILLQRRSSYAVPDPSAAPGRSSAGVLYREVALTLVC